MKIFITNDDGYYAEGIQHLVKIARKIGDVILVAPDRPQSGMSHAITLSVPLRLRQVVNEEGYQAYICNGTPVDCVKLGLKLVMKDEKPDMLLSGINHGSNASTNVIYSGTMAAAIEGAMEEIPSVGFSVLDHSQHIDFSPYDFHIKQIINFMKNAKPGLCLNVNMPKMEAGEEPKGICFCRQSQSSWVESYEERKDPFHANYYWLTGQFHNTDNGSDTDLYALDTKHIAVVPVQFDWTNYSALKELKDSII